MNDLQITYFLSVAETGNITETAKRFFVSPPAVSRQIQLVEEEMGGRLFARTGRGLQLLPAGVRLRDTLLLSQQVMADIRKEQLEQAQGTPTRLRFGLSDAWLLPGMLRDFHQALTARNGRLSIFCANPNHLLQWLADSQVDLILIPTGALGVPAELPFQQQYFQPLRYVLYYGAHSRLAQLRLTNQMSLAPLSQETLYVALDSFNAAEQESHKQFCMAHGFLPRRMENSRNIIAILNAVGAGQGFCILDNWSWAYHSAEFGKIIFSDLRHTSLFWRSGENPPLLRMAVDFLLSWRDQNGSE